MDERIYTIFSKFDISREEYSNISTDMKLLRISRSHTIFKLYSILLISSFLYLLLKVTYASTNVNLIIESIIPIAIIAIIGCPLLKIITYLYYSKKEKKLFNSYPQYLSKEKRIITFYEDSLNDLKNNHLYRKKSSSEKFKRKFTEYIELIEISESINRATIKNCIDTANHSKYMLSRLETLPLSDKETNKLEKISSKDIYAPPEDKYKETKTIKENIKTRAFKTRKINWEEVCKSFKLIGEQGELIVEEVEKDYLLSIGRKDLAEKVDRISETKGDGAGYDILSFNSEGKEKYIEVKTSVVSPTEPFYLTNNELLFLETYKHSSFIHRVYIDRNTEESSLKIYTADQVIAMNKKPIAFKVSLKGIKEGNKARK